MGICGINGVLWYYSAYATFSVMDELISRIHAFLDRHGMEPTTFGVRAINDGHLYAALLAGKRKLRRKTKIRIDDFLRTYKNGKRK